MNFDQYERPRSSGGKRPRRKRILVVTEGEVTEPTYFERLKSFLELSRKQLDVVVEPGPDYKGNTPTRVVDSAIKLRDDAKKMQELHDERGDLESRHEYDEVWVVFDTERDGKNPDLKSAAERAHALSLKPAISRPSFESWFILHFGVSPSASTCDDICKELSKITQREHKREYHKKSSDNSDLKWLIDLILPETAKAIRHSEMVAKTAFVDHTLVPSCTGTKVHELIQILWNSSPKGATTTTQKSDAVLNELLLEGQLIQTKNPDFSTGKQDLIASWKSAIVSITSSGKTLESAAETLLETVKHMSSQSEDFEHQGPALSVAFHEHVSATANGK